jgi:Concanavalin A-like lectin/glucanases superfamily
MTILATRLTNDGVLLTNAYFDEITKAWVSISPAAVYAGLFDEVFLSSGSLLFASNSDYLYGSNAVFDISDPATAWTFETWVYPQSAGAIFAIGNGTQYGQSLAIDWGLTSANRFSLKQGNGFSYPITMTTAGTYAGGSWYHVAVSYTASGLRTIYINGIDDASYMTSVSLSSANQWVVNGFYDNTGLGNGGGSGHLSNLRFVLGTSLYTANFTPPYAPLTAVDNTQLLLCMPNNGGAFVDISANAFRIQSQGSPQATVLKPFALNTVKRELSTGALQVSGYFDEQSGII